MKISCTANDDTKTVHIQLPLIPSKIGMFVSGGLDSAILYYLLLKANAELGDMHMIHPFVVPRTEGSKYFARPVIAHVHSQFNLPYRDPILVGDPSLPGHLQVKSGGDSAMLMGYSQLYGGVIDQLPEHTIGYEPAPVEENDIVKMPFLNLTKGHVINLIVRCKQEALFYITHSCSILEIGKCNTCNGCNERNWGFAQCGLTDPGTI
jgi:hypothetical protein